MKKNVLRLIAVTAAFALLASGAAQAIKLRVGTITIVANGGFTPTKLPKRRNAPIKLYGYAKFTTIDGSRPGRSSIQRPCGRLNSPSPLPGLPIIRFHLAFLS